MAAKKKRESYSRVWVDRTAVDVKVLLWQHLGTLVDSSSRTIENSTKHVFGNTKLQALAGKLDFGLYLSQPKQFAVDDIITLPSSHRYRRCLRKPIGFVNRYRK